MYSSDLCNTACVSESAPEQRHSRRIEWQNFEETCHTRDTGKVEWTSAAPDLRLHKEWASHRRRSRAIALRKGLDKIPAHPGTRAPSSDQLDTTNVTKIFLFRETSKRLPAFVHT